VRRFDSFNRLQFALLAHSVEHLVGIEEAAGLQRAPCADSPIGRRHDVQTVGSAGSNPSRRTIFAPCSPIGSGHFLEKSQGRFESCHGHHAPFAKRQRHLAYTQTFGGSSPSGSTDRAARSAERRMSSLGPEWRGSGFFIRRQVDRNHQRPPGPIAEWPSGGLLTRARLVRFQLVRHASVPQKAEGAVREAVQCPFESDQTHQFMRRGASDEAAVRSTGAAGLIPIERARASERGAQTQVLPLNSHALVAESPRLNVFS
jgi:hypothetical protein